MQTADHNESPLMQFAEGVIRQRLGHLVPDVDFDPDKVEGMIAARRAEWRKMPEPEMAAMLLMELQPHEFVIA